MNYIKLSILVFCLLSIMSCNQDDDTNPPIIDNALTDANNQFAFNFLQKIDNLETEKENYMVSPVSASLALSMTYNGAASLTQAEFENVLGYEDFTPEEINEINRSIIDGLQNANGTFDIANSIWYRDGFAVKQNFLDVNQTYYDAQVQGLNFADPTSKDIINDWVSDNTQGKIETILDEIPTDAVMYLINALYFKNNWQYEFDPADNLMLDFYDEDGISLGKKEMMRQQADLQYYEHEDLFTSVQLPYQDGGFTMTVFVPQDGKTTADVIDAMDSQAWNDWQANYEEKDIMLTLPKFKFAYKNKLNDELQNMGLESAFSNADFTNIADAQLAISEVMQKTFIDVNETGTEAAAVTSVGIAITSVDPDAPIYMTMNQPFIFIISDKATNSICFTGRIGDPIY